MSYTDRGKTFFFWNEEWRKLIQGSSPNLQNDLPAADFPTAGQNLSVRFSKFASTPVVLNGPNRRRSGMGCEVGR